MRATVVLIVLIIAGGLIALWFKGHSQPSAEHAPAPGPPMPIQAPPVATQDESPETITRSVSELEELVYQTPFDVDLQLELARAAWKSFEKSMRTDSEAASECGTAYLVAVLESGSRPAIVNEARKRINVLGAMAGGGENAYDNAFDMFRMIYEKATRPNIQHILTIRKAIEAACSRTHADERGIEVVIAAQVAMERYLQLAYDVEIGRQHTRPAGADGDFHFTRVYYDQWETKARSYGIIVRSNPNAVNSDVYAFGGLPAPIDFAYSQIKSGEKFGRFQMPDGREIVPGLRYFEDAAEAAAQEESAGSGRPLDESPGLGDPPSVESPVGMYRKMLDLQERGMWSAAFDLIEPETRRELIDSLRSVLAGALDGSAEQARVNAMGGRELWILVGKTGEVYPIRILAVENDGDHATLKIRKIKDGIPDEESVGCIRIDGKWKLSAK